LEARVTLYGLVIPLMDPATRLLGLVSDDCTWG